MAKLFIVGTPIGNLQDITLRALSTLREVQYIACEDSRVTSKLVNFFELGSKKYLVHNNFNESNSSNGIMKILEKGFDVALVSDAGMPVISDPGFLLIRSALKSDHELILIPGVSAVTHAFSLSNLSNSFTFLGFLTPKKIALENRFKKLEKETYVIFVSPHKIITMLEVINRVFDGKELIFLGRELTKKFETHYRGNALEILEIVKENIRGEYTLVLKI